MSFIRMSAGLIIELAASSKGVSLIFACLPAALDGDTLPCATSRARLARLLDDRALCKRFGRAPRVES